MPHEPKEWIESFRIFEKYLGETDAAITRAGHDFVTGGPDPETVSDEDKARLEELGWNDFGEGSFHAFI